MPILLKQQPGGKAAELMLGVEGREHRRDWPNLGRHFANSESPHRSERFDEVVPQVGAAPASMQKSY